MNSPHNASTVASPLATDPPAKRPIVPAISGMTAATGKVSRKRDNTAARPAVISKAIVADNTNTQSPPNSPAAEVSLISPKSNRRSLQVNSPRPIKSLVMPPTPSPKTQTSSAQQSWAEGELRCHPDYHERIDELRSVADKFRDKVLGALFHELKNVPVEGLIPCPGSSADPALDRAITATTVSALLEAISAELDSPLKDSSSALRDSAEALKRAVELVRLTEKRRDEADQAPQMIQHLVTVTAKKGQITGPQNRERTVQEAIDCGVFGLISTSLQPKTYGTVSVYRGVFAANALTLLSDGLACPGSRSVVRQLCLDEGIPETAELILKDASTLTEAKNAASEFAMHFADDPADRAYLAARNPDLLLDKNKQVALPTLMRVTTRKVRSARPLPDALLVTTPRTLTAHDGGTDLLEGLRQIIRQADHAMCHQDPESATAFAELVIAYASRRRIQAVQDTAAHEVLLRFMRAHADNPAVVGPILDAFSALSEDNVKMQMYTASHVPPAVKAEKIARDAECAYRYVDLLEDLVVFAESEATDNMAKQKVSRDLEVLEAACDPDDSPMLSSIQDVRKALNSRDDPLSLKEVYGVLMARSHGDESLNVMDDRSVKRMFNFTRKKTRELGVTEADDPSPAQATEFMYGCLSFQLLASVEDNHALLRRFNIPQLLMEAMACQKDEQVCQHAVLTALELCQYPALVEMFVSTQENINLIVSLLKRARQATEEDVYTNVEDLVGARVQLIEKTSLNRNTYKGSEAVQQLLETWDDFDYYFHGNIRVRTVDDLKSLFKAERKDKRRTQIAQKFGRRNSQLDAPGRRGSFSRRASLFFKKTEAASPPSQLGTPSPTTVSPLERRKSVVKLTRRQSVADQQGGRRNASASPSLIKRASQFFGFNKNQELEGPPGTVGAGGTIALARRASAVGAKTPQRRSSFFSRASPTSTASPAPSTNGLTKRASMLQRRASIQAPTSHAELHVLHTKLARKNNPGESGSGEQLNSPSQTRTGGEIRSTESAGGKWSDAEPEPTEEVFIPRMVEYIFKALRRTVGADEMLLLRSCNVPMRLVGLIADQETPPAALPDILYLVGVLAGSNKDMKDELGEFHAVEKVCSLLKRAYKEQGSFVSEVVTNASLCLATLCVVHVPNTKRFEKKKGPQLTVQALSLRGEYNDTQAVNGISALLCNLCFKNEEMKSLLGQAGACEALVHAMANYESTDYGREGSRCISSLFKAIGNLALNQHNMERLMSSDIEVAYASFLTQVDGTLDDATLEASLRTLSNLVIEKDNMERFAPIVVPFLSMLRRERTTSTEVHRWAFMTLAGLCRLPKNAQMFSHNDGIKTIIKLLPYIEQTPSLRASIICVLGIQTTYPDNVDLLVENGVFVIIADNLKEFMDLIARESETVQKLSNLKAAEAPPQNNEEQASVILTFSQLPISSLRCAHRCLAHQAAAEECISEKVLSLAQDVLLNSAFQPMLTYESLRVMLGCMALYGPQHFSSSADFSLLTDQSSRANGDTSHLVVEGDWGAKELDMLIDGEDPDPTMPPYVDPTEPQWLVRLGDHVRRAAEPRLWEELHMTEKLRQLTECIRTILSSDKAARNVRLQRCGLGFLVWISAERICIPSLLRRLHVPLDPVTKAPIEEDDETAEELDRSAGTHTVQKQLQRRTSVWDNFKKEKTPTESTPAEKKEGFGRERKSDHTSVIDIVSRTMDNLWFDERCIDLAFILLNNCIFMAFGSPELAALLADVTVYKEIKAFVDRHEDKARAYWILTSQNYKRFLQTEGKWTPLEETSHSEGLSDTSEKKKGSEPVGESSPAMDRKRILQPEDLNVMKALAFTTLPIDLTQWDFDPFPDGVQSLPLEVRKRLRDGGRAEVINAAGRRSVFMYKASHDLVLFEWKVISLEQSRDLSKDVDPQFPHALAVSRFSLMMAGIQHPWFERAAAFDRGVTENRCALLRGPSTLTCPEGVTLCLKFKDCRSRDSFLLTLSNWREACAFGFI